MSGFFVFSFSRNTVQQDVIIIGAGPAGSTAAALLVQLGYQVTIFEKAVFPRFSIGESLLPACMSIIEKAGMMPALKAQAAELGFQYKDGAAFVIDGVYDDFDFSEKSAQGWGSAFQVQRAAFDHLLVQQAQAQGVVVHYGHEVTAFSYENGEAKLQVQDAKGHSFTAEAKFVFDASGFGRVLPRLLSLEKPSDFPVRSSVFTHVADGIVDAAFDRNKISVSVHQANKDLWLWLIPFAGGRASLGCVGISEQIEALGADPEARLKAAVQGVDYLQSMLQNASFDTRVAQITGYSANVSTLAGPGYALLGNAGEFLDPVFSSGVTIAMQSADMAVSLLHRSLQGEVVDWSADYEQPLRSGVDVFRAFVDAWYDGRLQRIVVSEKKSVQVKKYICSILAGYVWDESNPYRKNTQRKLTTLAQLC